MKHLFIVLILTLTSCGTIDKDIVGDFKHSDYGTYPNDYTYLTKSFIRKTLMNPNHVIWGEMYEPQTMRVPFISSPMKKDYFSGYGVCVSLAMKDRLGSYTKPRKHLVMIYNGTVRLHFFDTWNEESLAHTLCPNTKV